MLKSLRVLLKKIKNLMAGFDIEELMSVKNAYQGQKFQWVKPPPQDKTKLATVVTVVDVIPGRRINTVNGPSQRYMVQLSDKTQIDSEDLTNRLMMLHDDQPPMSMAEVMSIYAEPELDVNAIKSSLPVDMQSLSTLDVLTKLTVPETLQPKSAPEPTVQTPSSREVAKVDTKGLFGMFSVEETDVNLKVTVELPAKNLLKMMLANSQDKEQFIDQLSAHINNSITLDAIKASVRTFMGQEKKKKDE